MVVTPVYTVTIVNVVIGMVVTPVSTVTIVTIVAIITITVTKF